METEDLDKELEKLLRGTVEVLQEDELRKKLIQSHKKKIPLRVKAGFDPTAPDLHLGHTVLLHKMRHFQELGHDVYFLIGDFTGMIGDPSGVSETRKSLSQEEVMENAKTYEKQVFKILDRDKTKVVFNSEWMKKMKADELIQLCAHYNVARMLERDDFKKRYLGQRPISIHEFLYPLIQGYDSVALQADVELGGTDQKFNLLVGRDLQRAMGQEPQVVMTLPLLEGTDGVKKMSKTAKNFIALEDSHNEMFLKIMKIPDNIMLRYYELLSDRSLEEIKVFEKEMVSGKISPRNLKMNLGNEIVARYHGKENANKARQVYEESARMKISAVIRGASKGIGEVSAADWKGDQIEVPSHEWKDKKLWICRLIVFASFANSNGSARRLIKQGAVRINGNTVADEGLELELKQVPFLLNVGKNKVVKIVFQKEL